MECMRGQLQQQHQADAAAEGGSSGRERRPWRALGLHLQLALLLILNLDLFRTPCNNRLQFMLALHEALSPPNRLLQLNTHT